MAKESDGLVTFWRYNIYLVLIVVGYISIQVEFTI